MQIKNLGAQMSVGIKGKLKKGRKGGVKTEEGYVNCVTNSIAKNFETENERNKNERERS
jgi:hypothetical protein